MILHMQVLGNTHFSGILSMECSDVRRMERSGEAGRGLREVLRGEELRSEEKDKPCLRISCTALSLPQKNTATHQQTSDKTTYQDHSSHILKRKFKFFKLMYLLK